MIKSDGDQGDNYLASFLKRYKTEFGFTLQNRVVLVDDIRVRGVGCTDLDMFQDQEGLMDDNDILKLNLNFYPRPIETVKVFFDDHYEDTKVYNLDQLPLGHRLQGPCIVMDKLSTILVERQCQCTVSPQGNLRIDIGGHEKLDKIGTELDTIQLSVFSHRFMSIAGE